MTSGGLDGGGGNVLLQFLTLGKFSWNLEEPHNGIWLLVFAAPWSDITSAMARLESRHKACDEQQWWFSWMRARATMVGGAPRGWTGWRGGGAQWLLGRIVWKKSARTMARPEWKWQLQVDHAHTHTHTHTHTHLVLEEVGGTK